MSPDTFTALFSYLCGQGRAFIIDGKALPVCQRCLGLYAGAALTGVWLLASGIWRRGLPERSVSIANILMLAAAMLGGLHIIDGTPAWRLTCGLWTGHVAMLWLVGGATHLRQAAARRRMAAELSTYPAREAAERALLIDPPWPRRDTGQALAAAPILAALAALFDRFAITGWSFWTGLAVLGVLMLTAALTHAASAVIAWARARRRG
jgi:uncharacterized membrane protein